MKPLRLIIKGLNSFAEAQTIDFEELSSRGIFGIFGPTGSGKTTILDGITLALYGDLARRSNGFVNSGEEVRQANISFVFRISGKVPRTYQVDRSYTKNKDFSKKPVSKSVLKEITGGEPLILEEGTGAVNQACQRLIGLTKEDFLRTVVLPQGKFSEFLMLTGKERNEMLERLFNLEKYGEALAGRIGEEKRKISRNMENLSGRLSGYEDISGEILKEIKGQQKSWEKEFKSLNIQARSMAEEFEKKKQIRFWTQEQEGYKAQMARLQQEEEQTGIWEKKIKMAEEVKAITPVLENCFRKTQQKEEKEANCLALKSALDKAGEERERAQSALEKAMREGEQIPDLEAKQRNLELAIPKNETLAALEEENQGRKKELFCLESFLLKLSETREQIKESLDEKKKEREQILGELENCQVSVETRKLVQDGVILERDYQAAGRELKKWENLKKSMKEQIVSQEETERKLKEEENRIFEELSKYRAQEREQMARIFREDLEEGKPCPVCGSIHHNLTLVLEEGKERSEEERKQGQGAEELEEGFRKIQKKHGEAQVLLSASAAKKEAAEETVKEQRIKMEKMKKDWEFIRNACPRAEEETFPKMDPGSAFDFFHKKQAQINEMDEKTQKLRLSERELTEKIKSLEEKQEKTRREETQSQIEKAHLEAQKKEAEEAAKSLKKEIASLAGECRDVKKELEEVKSRIESIEGTVKRAKEALEEKTRNFQEAEHRLDVEKTSLSHEKSELEEAKALLSQTLLQCPGLEKEMEEQMISLKEAAAVWKETDEKLAFLKEKIRCHQEETVRLTNLMKEKALQLDGRSLTEEEWNQALLEKEEMETCLENQSAQGTRLADQVSRETRRLQEKEALLAEYEKKEHRWGLILQMEKLIKGKRFVEYVAREKLSYVSREASVFLRKLSRGNYELECNEQGHFRIIDYKNGGIRREVGTLSGGEIFLASLSLALALSSQIQLTNHAPLELFFLDEGFGTLDDSLLDVVMEALESLHGFSSRAIGLITHVEKIRSQIPVKLMVTPAESGGRGSRVEIVYS